MDYVAVAAAHESLRDIYLKLGEGVYYLSRWLQYFTCRSLLREVIAPTSILICFPFQNEERRMLGSYYRVGLYGKPFGKYITQIKASDISFSFPILGSFFLIFILICISYC